ncbi:hypothetical protein FH609_004250 [Streptomyces sp. 3MP-14]|uniref:Uncharacterized protein n=1 Tax=Streptomyces mimosae TaxID=2586635 RepID=A0A5N6A2E3_9ACTN|nr:MULTISPECIES: hypothetical protein [Streptomyces]KAB8162944.1 hypothetical protein FH607_020110 [Streptomyces mimosae]KAB8179158.1 hypothetical protein FH609_004250 [Streptomyces sp. 3MP-14]
MNLNQTADLLELLSAANVLNRMEAGTPDVWHAALGDLDYRDCMAAAADLIRTQQWVKIADIRKRVGERRSQAAADYVGPGLSAEIPDADPDDVAGYLAALRAGRQRAASGLERPRPVAALVAGVGRAVPAPRREPGPMSIPCPRCTAPMGRGCRLPSGRPRGAGPHRERAQAARQRWEATS